MHKVGLVLTLLAAAVAASGAESAKSVPAAASGKSVKAAQNAPAGSGKSVKAAPAKSEAKVSAVPWLIPNGALELKSGENIDVPAEGRCSRLALKAGGKFVFRLVDVSSGDSGKWEVSAVDAVVAKVAPAGSDKGGLFKKATVSFEIAAIKAGRTLLEMSLKDRRGAPIRIFRCYIEVK